jgi:hypothetical protein
MRFIIDKSRIKNNEHEEGTPMRNNNENKVLFGLAGMETAWALLTNMAASVAMQA